MRVVATRTGTRHTTVPGGQPEFEGRQVSPRRTPHRPIPQSPSTRPGAEMLCHNVGPAGKPDDVLVKPWAATVDLDDVVRILFDDCVAHGITADELVGDDYTPTQDSPTGLQGAGSQGLIDRAPHGWRPPSSCGSSAGSGRRIDDPIAIR
jgi:hypothetical protein